MAQNKVTINDNIVSFLDCMVENHSEIESSDSDHKSGISDSEQSDRQVAPVVSGWHDVKWRMKIWLLGVLQWHDVHPIYQACATYGPWNGFFVARERVVIFFNIFTTMHQVLKCIKIMHWRNYI
jgi:hypothetical protein